jgi:hypothetical protein
MEDDWTRENNPMRRWQLYQKARQAQPPPPKWRPSVFWIGVLVVVGLAWLIAAAAGAAVTPGVNLVLGVVAILAAAMLYARRRALSD